MSTAQPPLKAWQGQFYEGFLDDTGAFSMGRFIAFLGAALGVELVQAGLAMAIFAPSGQGVAIIGIGAGFFSGGALLKFGSKGQEARVQPSPSTDDSSTHI